jgi:hypothetical protein
LDQEEPEHTKLPLGQGYTALLAQHRVPIAISTTSRELSEARTFDQWSTDPGETFVSVPLLARKELVGVINLQHHRPADTASEKSSCFPASDFCWVLMSVSRV